MNEKVSAGEEIALRATTWNEIVDSKNDFLRRKLSATNSAASFPASIKIRNDTSNNLRKGEVVEFGGYPLADSYLAQQYAWLKGVTPDLTHAGFGIVSQAIPDGDFGPCVTSGTCMALVNVVDENHQYAKLVNSRVLRSAETGQVRIDYKPGGTGEVTAIVTISPTFQNETLIVFQLTSALINGSQAAASRCELSGSTWVPTGGSITVADAHGLWGGLSGYRGVAFQRADGKYEIVFMQRNDLMVAFHLNVDRDPGFAFMVGVLDYSFQHGNKVPPLTSGTLTIHDPFFLFKYALKDAKGLAIYNDRIGRYEAVACQQRCTLARAQVNDTGGFFDAVDVNIDNFRAASPPPFTQVPETLPTTAFNRFKHMGRDDDLLLLAWDEVTNDWIIVDVSKHQQAVTIGLRLNADKTKIQTKEIICALEYQDDITAPDRWVDKLDVGTC